MEEKTFEMIFVRWWYLFLGVCIRDFGPYILMREGLFYHKGEKDAKML